MGRVGDRWFSCHPFYSKLGCHSLTSLKCSAAKQNLSILIIIIMNNDNDSDVDVVFIDRYNSNHSNKKYICYGFQMGYKSDKIFAPQHLPNQHIKWVKFQACCWYFDGK